MRCADVKRDLFRYSEGSMGRWKALLIWAHIARCESCQERLAILRASKQNITSALREPVDTPDIASSVMAIIGSEPLAVVRKPRRAMAYAFAATSALAVFLVVAVYLPNRPKPTHTPVAIAKKTPIRKHYQIEREVIARRPVSAHTKVSILSAKQSKRAAPKEQCDKSTAPFDGAQDARRWRAQNVRKLHSQDAGKRVCEKQESVRSHHTTKPQPIVASQQRADGPKPSYVVVVHIQPQPSSLNIEAVDTRTGLVTVYSNVNDGDGKPQVSEITYTPETKETEESRT